MSRKHFMPLAALAAALVTLAGCAMTRPYAPVRVKDYRETIRVACVGDSITFGRAMQEAGQKTYPDQLADMLGRGWETRNFGVGGATMLKKGNKPYWEQTAFQEALAYRPHVVVIMLGTNDSKPDNWAQHGADYARDYAEMIDTFAVLPTHPRIWVCYPVPAYSERFTIRDSVIRNEMIPAIAKLAREKRIAVIDLYKALSGKPELFPDEIHPNAKGAGLMAAAACEALTGKQPTR